MLPLFPDGEEFLKAYAEAAGNLESLRKHMLERGRAVQAAQRDWDAKADEVARNGEVYEKPRPQPPDPEADARALQFIRAEEIRLAEEETKVVCALADEIIAYLKEQEQTLQEQARPHIGALQQIVRDLSGIVGVYVEVLAHQQKRMTNKPRPSLIERTNTNVTLERLVASAEFGRTLLAQEPIPGARVPDDHEDEPPARFRADEGRWRPDRVRRRGRVTVRAATPGTPTGRPPVARSAPVGPPAAHVPGHAEREPAELLDVAQARSPPGLMASRPAVRRGLSPQLRLLSRTTQDLHRHRYGLLLGAHPSHRHVPVHGFSKIRGHPHDKAYKPDWRLRHMRASDLRESECTTMTESEAGPATSRSYEAHGVGQQLYAVIESCTSPETLWAKIDSGNWDWLGVQEKNGKVTYLLGRPPVARTEAIAAATVSAAGSESGVHGVEVRTPHRSFRGVSAQWCRSPEQARQAFAETVERLKSGPGSALYNVRLLVDGQVAEERVVIRTLPNRL